MFAGLKGRTALVTGGSRGIGRECCRLLAAAGAQVALTYRSDRRGADETVRLVAEQGAAALAVQADAAAPNEVEAMARRVADELGPIELLVNNAGIFEIVTHQQTTLAHWQRMLDVNLTGVYLTTWAVKDEMIRRRFGRIVNIASIAGIGPRPNCIAYAVSKAGVISFTKSVAVALAEHDIRVNALAPGLIETAMTADVDQETRQALLDATPISRLGTAEEMARTVMFLLSDESSFTTGQTYVASGGRELLP
jgi:3-oxoacyl-[acyl-carrier protein] reductase